jgi:hypothetical protein
MAFPDPLEAGKRMPTLANFNVKIQGWGPLPPGVSKKNLPWKVNTDGTPGLFLEV